VSTIDSLINVHDNSVAALSASTGLNEVLTAFDYTLEESEIGFQHFVVVETVINWMDWYYTHSKGNRRARFIYDENKLLSSSWLMP
jgi:hypothetical protein